MKPAALLTLTGALLFSTSSYAGIIFDNGSPDTLDRVTGWASDLSFSREIGDDFSLNTTSVVNSIQWWGAFTDELPGHTDDFTIRIFDMNVGTPDENPIFEQNVGEANVDSSRIIPRNGGVFEYEYTTSIAALTLGPGDYMLSIVNETDPNELRWYWNTSFYTGSSWRRTDGDTAWTHNEEEFAFTLRGTKISEPGILALFFSGLTLLFIRRRNITIDKTFA